MDASGLEIKLGILASSANIYFGVSFGCS